MMKTSLAIALSALSTSSVTAFTSTNAPCAKNTLALNAMPDRMWDTMVDPTERSAAMPFLPRPINCDGTLAGDIGFDPFYLSSIPKNFAGFIQPPQWEEVPGISTIYWMREAELKHGRVCMLATTGWLAADGAFGFPLRFPGAIYSVENVPTSYAAHDVMVQQGSMGFLLLVVGFLEFCMGAVLVEVASGESDRAAGDYGLDFLNFLKDKTEEEVAEMKLKEIQHARLAMLGFAGIVTQSGLSEATHAFPYF